MTKKDDADLRAEALVQVRYVSTNSVGDRWMELAIGSRGVGGFWERDRLDERVKEEIACTIRAAVADATLGRDKILTDLLCNDTERGEEMWRLGAEAMREEIAIDLAAKGFEAAPSIAREALIPQPPSVSATGEVLQPSRLRMQAEKMEKALREIVKYESINNADPTCSAAWEIATEALEDDLTQSGD